jgi:outer membrane protein
MRRISSICTCVLVLPLAHVFLSRPILAQTREDRQVLSLSECLRIAMEKNHSRPASQFAVAIAEAQHRQALASYWPQVTAKAGIDQMSSSPNFQYPASTMYIPAQSITVPGGTASVTIPANAFGPGFPPVAIQMPVSFPDQTINTSTQAFPIPAQNVKLMSPTTESVYGAFEWLLADGGMRRGYKEQALGALAVAKAEVRRTDSQIKGDIARFYFGARSSPASCIGWGRKHWNGWRQLKA